LYITIVLHRDYSAISLVLTTVPWPQFRIISRKGAKAQR